MTTTTRLPAAPSERASGKPCTACGWPSVGWRWHPIAELLAAATITVTFPQETQTP